MDIKNTDQAIKYLNNGLTYISNDINIHPRDAAGNIILHENGINNPLLIIEPITELISVQSMLRVLDTRFNYFKFPVTTTIDIDDSILDNTEIDAFDDITTRYTIPTITDEKGQTSEYVTINTSFPSNWFYGNQTSSGYKTLPFSGGQQKRIGTFQVTRGMIERMRSLNQTIRFRIQVQCYSTIQNSPTQFRMKLQRRETTTRGFISPVVVARSNDMSTEWHGSNSYPVLYLEYILDPFNDAIEYDMYEVLIVSGNPSYILAESCYWNIDLIDIPETQAIWGWVPGNVKKNSGVYSLKTFSKLATENPGESQLQIIGEYISNDTFEYANQTTIIPSILPQT